MNTPTELEKLVRLKRAREQRKKTQREEILASEALAQEVFLPETAVQESQSVTQSSLYPLFQQGQAISHGEHTYTIQDLLYQTEQRQTYLAEQDGQAVTLKVVTLPHRSVADEVQRLQERLMQVNAVLDRECRVFALSPMQYAIASTYLPGNDLKEEIKEKNRTYTEKETIDFLVKMLEGDIATLHGKSSLQEKKSANGTAWTHGDIKPRNIVLTKGSSEERKYTLIDFGNVHRNDAERTLTLRDVEGSWNYRRLGKSTYEKEDDYFALARVAYFLLTGQDPAMLLSGTEKMQKTVDEEQFKALPIRKELQEILLRMQGYGKQYKGIEGMVDELKRLKEGLEKKIVTDEVGERESIFTTTKNILKSDKKGILFSIACVGFLVSGVAGVYIALIEESQNGLQRSLTAITQPAELETPTEACFIGRDNLTYSDANCDGVIDESFGNNVKGAYGTVVDFWNSTNLKWIDGKVNHLVERKEGILININNRGMEREKRGTLRRTWDRVGTYFDRNELERIDHRLEQLRKERKKYE